MFKQCINEYLQKYSSQIVRHSKQSSIASTASIASFKNNLNEEELNEDSRDKARETIRSLLKFEKILKLKELKIKTKAKTVKNELIKLKSFAEKLEQEKKRLKDLKVSKELNTQDERRWVNEQIFAINENWALIKAKLSFIETRESQLDSKQIELEKYFSNIQAELAKERNEINILRIKSEKTEWDLMKRLSSLKSQESLLNLKLENLMQEKLDLDQEKALYHSKKLKVLLDKSCSSPRVLRQDSDRQALIFDLSPVNTSGDVVCGSPILFESKSGENGKDFDLAYIELNEQIEKINKDFELQEQSLQIREAELAELSQVLNEKFHQNSMIFQCLSQSKSYIDEFTTQTITEIETNSQVLVDLVTSLKSQKAELEFLTEKVHKQLALLKVRSAGLDTIREDPSELSDIKLSEEPETLDTESE